MAIEPISQFHGKLGRYPGNNKQWWVARVEIDNSTTGQKAGDFTPEILDKLFTGNTRAPRGHYILDAFYKDRSTMSGVAGLPVEITNERPSSVTFFSGRIWYSCNTTVYFSQLLTERYKAGLCFQEADPTSEEISDLIATDGGEIPIPEAGKIVRIVPNSGGILVFAINGVWNITGTNAGFSALDISVNKVSPVGCRSPMSVVETDTAVYWWSDVGILGMAQQSGMYGPIPGAYDRTNISEQTIQSYYNDIPESAKQEAKGVFDAKANRIVWLFRDNSVLPNQYNKALLYDISLGAFYPWQFSQLETTDDPFLKGLFVSLRANTITNQEDIVVGGTPLVVAGEAVVVDVFDSDVGPTSIEYTAMRNEELRFAQVANTDFADWKTVNGVGVKYDSYVETGYELFNDAMRSKAITYVMPYFRRTEETWSNAGLDDPSSCFMRVKWGWSNSAVSGKWTNPVQVYRPGRFIPMNINGTYDTGFAMVVTKNKVRGNGKAIQFRFGTDEIGRNFDLHGWSVAVTGNTIV